MGHPFQFDPVHLETPIETANRTIRTAIPHPDDRKIVETLRRCEPLAMRDQPPIVWDRAEGVHIHDRHGNQWIDFTSGVLVANAGHGLPAATAAINEVANRPLHHSFGFLNPERAALVEYLVDRCAPDNLDKAILLTTGSESVECAMKIARAYGHDVGGRDKDYLVTFREAFHGRTLGSQTAGGIPALKEWIVHPDPCMVNVPTPDGFRGSDTSFEGFRKALSEQGVDPKQIAGVCLETYQGGTALLLPKEYMRQLRAFCDEHDALLIFDEVQAGFGRCGRMWGFEHYQVAADMIVCGKGISSGLPLSAVIGHSNWMDLFPPGSMTATHTGNPICCAAALSNIKTIVEGGLIENAARLGEVFQERMARFEKKYPGKVGRAAAIGAVAAIQLIQSPGNLKPDHDSAFAIIKHAVARGLMLFGPVGLGGGTVKLCPPLCITVEQLVEGLDVLEASFDAVLAPQ